MIAKASQNSLKHAESRYVRTIKRPIEMPRLHWHIQRHMHSLSNQHLYRNHDTHLLDMRTPTNIAYCVLDLTIIISKYIGKFK